jgi:hypothetical protein
VKDKKVSLDVEAKPAREILALIAKQTGYDIEVRDKKLIVKLKAN